MFEQGLKKSVLALALAAAVLAGCGEEVNPVLGRWQGTVTDEQRAGLRIENRLENGRLEIEFTPDIARINGASMQVQYNKNGDIHFINEIGTNRTMNARFDGPDRMELRIPHHFKRSIVGFAMTRVSE